MKITFYTDGACSGNPGPGGWAVAMMANEKIKVVSGGEKETTNNRMEIKAILEALKIVDGKLGDGKRDEQCEIYSDSAYAVNAINNGWLTNWIFNGWKTAKGDPVKNVDLWVEISSLLNVFSLIGPKVAIKKVKGHNGNTFNEMVDQAARKESMRAKEL